MPGQSESEVLIDLYADWVEMLRDLIVQEGYALTTGDDGLKVFIKYWNLKRRQISNAESC